MHLNGVRVAMVGRQEPGVVLRQEALHLRVCPQEVLVIIVLRSTRVLRLTPPGSKSEFILFYPSGGRTNNILLDIF